MLREDSHTATQREEAIKAAQNVYQLGNWLDHEVRAMAEYILAPSATGEARIAELEAKLAARRPYSDKLAQEVIAGQVKEIDRLTALVQEERAKSNPSATREATIEECAKVCERAAEQAARVASGRYQSDYLKGCKNEANSLAAAIRTLKVQPASTDANPGGDHG